MGLMPRDNRFYDLFSKAAGNTLAGAKLMEEFIALPLSERPRVAAQIKEVEHAGDDVTHQIMQALNTSFITPFDREDIARLAGRMDDVLDAFDDAAELTVLYRVDALPDAVWKQVSLLKEAAALTVDVMPKLRTMKGVEEYWITVNDLENQADTVYRSLLAELFNDGVDPVQMIKLKEVIDQMEAAADAFEHVADVVQTIALKES